MALLENPTFAAWVGAIFTLAIYTYLWKENPVFRLAEHIYAALAVGYGICYYWHGTLKPALTENIAVKKEYYLILAIIVALLIYLRYFPKVAWLARIPMSIWVGYGVGYVLSMIPAPFLTQVTNSFIKFVPAKQGAWYATNTVNNILFFVCLTCTLMYFFFTVKRNNPVMGVTSTVGRWTLMLAFGAAFGNTVQARISIFIGRLQFLLGTWLGLLK